ncbi:transmembrane protein 214-A [Nilaparvata lugens]|uniref:transmembrane protein 214-A n=1 Tax=Nilaparvata lugens TaxID=108931 RepID=UPI00193D6EC5|nr:transmembrane protein 214-A [Nilaparvata lugens]
MSGQWEVVGKNRKDKNNVKKLSKSEKKKIIDNAPKVEDLLPLSQVKTLYSALDINKDDDNKPAEKSIKTKENEAKKAQAKQPDKKKAKEPVEKAPKSLKSAVNALTLESVSLVIETGKARFKEAPLVWLKSLASFLNLKLPVEQKEVTFTSKSFETPMGLLNPEIRNLIKKELKDVPEPIIQTLYDYCLTSMANDMTKGGTICGYKMLLQILAINYPSVTIESLEKSLALMNSYQNRQAIGSSILWAVGQGGYKDLSIGLQVWQEVMFPVCELRNYSRYVLDYLKCLLARHSTSKALNCDQFFSIVDAIHSTDLKLPNPIALELKSNTKQLREIASNQCDSLHEYFELLLARMPEASNQLRDELVKFAVTCLLNSPRSLTIWKQLYKDNLQQSAWILKSLNSDWSSIKEKVPEIAKTLSGFKSINENMKKSNQKAAGLQDCTMLCEALVNKKMAKSKKSSGFPFFKLFFLLIVGLAAFVGYQVNTYGSLRASPTGKLLKGTGVVEGAEATWKKISIYSDPMVKWTRKNGPVYYEKVSNTTSPYIKKGKEYALVGYKNVAQAMSHIYSFIVEKLPFVGKWVDTYAPSKAQLMHGLDLLSQWSKVFLQFVLKYGIAFVNIVVQFCGSAYEWLLKNVFVGEFSSEKLQKYAVEGLNATYKFASQTYLWVQDKFITLYT